MSSPSRARARTLFQDLSNNQPLGEYHQPIPNLCYCFCCCSCANLWIKYTLNAGTHIQISGVKVPQLSRIRDPDYTIEDAG